MKDGVFERVRGLAADVFDVPRHGLGPDTSPEQVAAWDSIRHLSLVLALESQFDLRFDLDEVVGMTTLGRIADLVTAKLGHPPRP